MAGSILTPSAIWKGFKLDGEKNIETVEEFVKDGIIITRFYFNGKKTDGNPTRVFAVSARSEKFSFLPCVYVLPDFDKDIDEDLLIKLAKNGYYVVSTDFSGKKENKKYYTVYPENAAFANYEKAKGSLFSIEHDYFSSAWYEWDCVGKYALAYILSLPFVLGVGAVGVKTGASVLWHIAYGEKRLSCAAFLFDAGWNAYFYKNNYKFDGVTPDFHDGDLKFLAGSDAQAYASLIKIPTLILSATNSEEYDFDRAADTLSRTDKNVYAAMDYSVNADNVLDFTAYNDLTLFLATILLKGSKPEKVLPESPDISCEYIDGALSVSVDAVTPGLNKVVLYATEENLKQSLRAWKAVAEIESDESCGGRFIFNYQPLGDAESCLFFARAEYENGFNVSSNVICKKIDESERKSPRKSNVVFSGREDFSESVFAPYYEKDYKSCIDDKEGVSLEKGPMGIYGITGKRGIITYKINSKSDKPAADAVFLIDVYAESDAKVVVSLVAEDKTEYSFAIEIKASKVWRNYKAPANKFKSAGGKPMKDYSRATAIKITGEGKYLINNFLWV